MPFRPRGVSTMAVLCPVVQPLVQLSITCRRYHTVVRMGGCQSCEQVAFGNRSGATSNCEQLELAMHP